MVRVFLGAGSGRAEIGDERRRVRALERRRGVRKWEWSMPRSRGSEIGSSVVRWEVGGVPERQQGELHSFVSKVFPFLVYRSRKPLALSSEWTIEKDNRGSINGSSRQGTPTL